MRSQDAQQELGRAFMATTIRFFHFLEERFGFRYLDSNIWLVKYSSSNVVVNVFHRQAGGELGVEFGLITCTLPSSRQPFIAGEEGGADKEAGSRTYELKIALPALLEPAELPPELQSFANIDEVHAAFDPLKVFDAWWSSFEATTVERVELLLPRLAELTRRLAPTLLIGSVAAFQRVEEFDSKLTEAYSKRVHLGFLPSELADTLRDKPLSEIIRVRGERGWR